MKSRSAFIFAGVAVIIIILAASAYRLLVTQQPTTNSTTATLIPTPHFTPPVSTLPTFTTTTASSSTTPLCPPLVPSSNQAPSIPRFSFNESAALEFYLNSQTQLGLQSQHPNSSTIYLADTQALDYYSLLYIYQNINNSTALDLSQTVCRAMQNYGGLFSYWNPAFEVTGNYGPYASEIASGANFKIGTVESNGENYSLYYTSFTPDPGFNYSEFADLTSYRVLIDMNYGNYSLAESDFATLSRMWNGQGFVDAAYKHNEGYQSYKLADYLIAWNSIANNPQTEQFALSYKPIVENVTSIMSVLQDPSRGGVGISYFFSNNQIEVRFHNTNENGETTSLFEIAWSEWSA